MSRLKRTKVSCERHTANTIVYLPLIPAWAVLLAVLVLLSVAEKVETDVKMNKETEDKQIMTGQEPFASSSNTVASSQV